MLEKKKRSLRVVAGLVLAAALVACGGGGGSDGGQDRVDLRGRNLFPMSQGDTWIYDRTYGNSQTLYAETSRTITQANGRGAVTMQEYGAGQSEDVLYEVTEQGLVRQDPLGVRQSFPGMYKAMPSFLEYPNSVIPGRARSLRESGQLGRDLDGDGRDDAFDAEISQVFEGFESITVLGETREVARFTTRSTVTFRLSGVGHSAQSSFTIAFTDQTVFAPGLGLVKATRSVQQDGGPATPQTLLLRRATVGGVEHASTTIGVDRNLVVASGSRLQSNPPPVESVVVTTRDVSGHVAGPVQWTSTYQGVVHVTSEPISATQTRVDIHLRTAQGMPLGTYNDTLTLKVCGDSQCALGAMTKPLTINVSYTVTDDVLAERGIDPLAVLSRRALTHNVIDSEYSRALDAIVMVSSWPSNALYVYDTATGTERQVALSRVPTAVSVSPDGTKVAVGHDALVSYVDLASVGQAGAPAPVLLDVSTNVFDLALDGQGSVHVVPLHEQWVNLHSIDIASNTESLVGWLLRAGSRIRFNTGVSALYTANNDVSPSDIAQWRVVQGVASYVGDSPYHGDYEMCGNVWMSENSATIYTPCGNTFKASGNAAQDMRYTGALALSSATHGYRIVALSESSLASEVALVEASTYDCFGSGNRNSCATHLNLYASDSLGRVSSLSIPPVLVNGRRYAQQGLAVFHDSTGQKLFMVSRLSNLLDPAAEYYISVVR